jgi:hypothetical protein
MVLSQILHPCKRMVHTAVPLFITKCKKNATELWPKTLKNAKFMSNFNNNLIELFL